VTPHLVAQVRAGIVEAQLALPATTVAVLGPNASGKTTLLRAVAGLVPNAGRVVVDGRDLSHVPPDRRGLGYVPQGVALFGHLDVLDNVAYGVRSQGRGRAAARRVATRWLERLGLTDVATRRPRQLSGGQAQRVALARALATDPQVLLLDEPLSALDVAARAEVRAELRRHLGSFGGTSLVVSHDPADAWALADLTVVLEDGRVVQQGRFDDVAQRPASAWLAQLLGLNAWPGVLSGSTLRISTGASVVALVVDGGTAAGDVTASVPPTRVALSLDVGVTSTPNTWTGVVSGLERHGDRLLVHVEGELPLRAETTTTTELARHLREGLPVRARVEPADVTLAPRGSRDTLGTPPDPPRPWEDA
jgi:molybdate transport system ATP-binding protein